MNLARQFLSSLPNGPRGLLLLYALCFPAALLGNYTGAFHLYTLLGLSPALVWKGQLWRILSYAFLPAGILDWVVTLFWFATFIGAVGRSSSARQFWTYCLIAAAAGALPIALLQHGRTAPIVGATAIIFALLVAWEHDHRTERILLLGIGEVTVRQAAVGIALISILLLWINAGGVQTLSMLCGGVAGWIGLSARDRLRMRRPAGLSRSERVARLEL